MDAINSTPLFDYLAQHWRGVLGWLWLITGVALALRITLQRRAPAATMAWILALCLVPFVGIIAYHFFGPQKVKRQTVRRLRSHHLLHASNDLERLLVEYPQPPLWAVQHSRMIEANCGIPPSSCVSVGIINGGAATLQSLLADIAQAQHHVHLEYYIFEPDRTGNSVISALIKALHRGVQVRLLVDDLGSSNFMGNAGIQLRHALTEAGGELAAFHPTRLDIWKPMLNLRTHRKIVVCDGTIGYVGGINITDEQNEWVNKDTAYRDTHVRLQGGAVRWLQYVFLEDWAYTTKQYNYDEGSLFIANSTPGDYAVHVVASGPDSDNQAIHHSVLHAIHAAQHRVWLTTPYFVPTEPAWYALLNAALRGVDVRILVPKRSDSFWVTMAARSYFKKLYQAGAKVYEYTGAMLHAKTLLADDQYSMVGTANFDNRSFLLNFEISLAFYSTELNQQLADMFEHDCTQAQRVTHKSRRIRWYKQWAEAIARLFSPLL